MRGSMLRELIVTAALSLTMSASLSYGAVRAIDHLLGPSEEVEVISFDAAPVDSD